MNRTEEKIILIVPEETVTPCWSIAMIIMFVWALLGILGLATSLTCFAYEGTFMQNWVGFLTSIVLGPFYWIYFVYGDPSYCSSKKSLQQTPMITKKYIKGGRKATKKFKKNI